MMVAFVPRERAFDAISGTRAYFSQCRPRARWASSPRADHVLKATLCQRRRADVGRCRGTLRFLLDWPSPAETFGRACPAATEEERRCRLIPCAVYSYAAISPDAPPTPPREFSGMSPPRRAARSRAEMRLPPFEAADAISCALSPYGARFILRVAVAPPLTSEPVGMVMHEYSIVFGAWPASHFGTEPAAEDSRHHYFPHIAAARRAMYRQSQDTMKSLP